jgi:hypothetical protein
MPVFALAPAAATAFWGATAAATVAGTGLYAAHKQGQAAEQAAETQASSADKAAQLASQSNQAALDFAKQQAEADWRNSETANRANYEQNAARERRLGTLGGLIGRGPREIPDYVASQDPNFTGGGQPGGAPGGAPAGGGGGGDPKVDAFIANWRQTHNAATEGIAPLADALQKAGLSTGRFMYGNTPSNNEVVVGGQKYKVIGAEGTPGAFFYQAGTDDSAPGAAPTTQRSPYVPGSLGAYVPLTSRLPVTAPLQMAKPRYQPGSLGGYLGGY